MWGDTWVYPLIPDLDKPAWLRIFVFGHVYRDDKATDKKVGGFVDVILKP